MTLLKSFHPSRDINPRPAKPPVIRAFYSGLALVLRTDREPDGTNGGLRESGNVPTRQIAGGYPGGLPEWTFNTPFGARRVDILTSNAIGIETKVGRTSLSSATRAQIAKHEWLINNGRLSGSEWKFTASQVTGKGGADSKTGGCFESS